MVTFFPCFHGFQTRSSGSTTRFSVHMEIMVVAAISQTNLSTAALAQDLGVRMIRERSWQIFSDLHDTYRPHKVYLRTCLHPKYVLYRTTTRAMAVSEQSETSKQAGAPRRTTGLLNDLGSSCVDTRLA